IIKRGQHAIAITPLFSVRMVFIFENLVLQSDTRFTIGIIAFFYKILDAAVGSLGQFKFKLQFKSIILFFSNDISARTFLLSRRLANGEYSILHAPPFFRKCFLVKSSPVIRCFTIPQEGVTLHSLLSRKMIRNQIHDKGIIIRSRIKSVRLDTNISPADLFAFLISIVSNAMYL